MPPRVQWRASSRAGSAQPASTVIFAQGDPAGAILHIESGAVRLSVVSHAGKEAVVAVLESGHFFGEGCLAGQTLRMATATTMTACDIVSVEKAEMSASSTPGPPSRTRSCRTC